MRAPSAAQRGDVSWTQARLASDRRGGVSKHDLSDGRLLVVHPANGFHSSRTATRPPAPSRGTDCRVSVLISSQWLGRDRIHGAPRHPARTPPQRVRRSAASISSSVSLVHPACSCAAQPVARGTRGDRALSRMRLEEGQRGAQPRIPSRARLDVLGIAGQPCPALPRPSSTRARRRLGSSPTARRDAGRGRTRRRPRPASPPARSSPPRPTPSGGRAASRARRARRATAP